MRVHHRITGVVLSVPLPVDGGNIHSPSRPWNEWDDSTTPRTDNPVRFSKGQHYVYRGGSIVRVARMGTSSRIA